MDNSQSSYELQNSERYELLKANFQNILKNINRSEIDQLREFGGSYKEYKWIKVVALNGYILKRLFPKKIGSGYTILGNDENLHIFLIGDKVLTIECDSVDNNFIQYFDQYTGLFDLENLIRSTISLLRQHHPLETDNLSDEQLENNIINEFQSRLLKYFNLIKTHYPEAKNPIASYTNNEIGFRHPVMYLEQTGVVARSIPVRRNNIVIHELIYARTGNVIEEDILFDDIIPGNDFDFNGLKIEYPNPQEIVGMDIPRNRIPFKITHIDSGAVMIVPLYEKAKVIFNALIRNDGYIDMATIEEIEGISIPNSDQLAKYINDLSFQLQMYKFLPTGLLTKTECGWRINEDMYKNRRNEIVWKWISEIEEIPLRLEKAEILFDNLRYIIVKSKLTGGQIPFSRKRAVGSAVNLMMIRNEVTGEMFYYELSVGSAKVLLALASWLKDENNDYPIDKEDFLTNQNSFSPVMIEDVNDYLDFLRKGNFSSESMNLKYNLSLPIPNLIEI